MFFAAEVKQGAVQFAEVTQKNRGGKTTVYPSKTASHNGLEKGKFTYIDSKKDITSVRFLKSNDKDAYEVIKYGETIKLKVQTRNLEGTELNLKNILKNNLGSGIKEYPQNVKKKVENEKAEWTLNTGAWRDWAKNKSGVALYQVEIVEADGDKVKYPNEKARLIDGKLDWTKLITYKTLKLSDTTTLDQLAKTNAPLIIGEPLEVVGNHHEDGKCPRCEEEITVKQLNDTVGNENDQAYRQSIVKYLNQFIEERKGKSNELHINTCLLKAHFISQIVTETSLLKIKLTEGETGSYYSKENIKGLWPGKYNEMVKDGTLESISSERPQKQLLNYVYGSKNGNKGGNDGWNYRGRGLIQLTGRGNYKDAATYLKQVHPDKYVNFEEQYEKPAEVIYAVLSAIAFWEGKGVYNIAKDKKEISDVPFVRNLINHHDRNNPKAQTYFKNAVDAFKVNDCTPISINAKEIITYRVYWNSESKGKIEKHIPKEIKEEYKNKYKYVYIDKNNFEHDICVVEWHKTKQKSVGHLKDSKPTHSAIVSDKTVSEGNTTRRVKYQNGDIAEYGSHPSKGKIWRLYVAGTNDIELVRMPDSLNYVKDGIIIKYSFSESQRRYTSPGHLAGFIGGLAENGFTITTTGSCFEEGSAFPSYDHSNGKSIDTLYLNDADEQKFINALVKFNFNIHLRGSNSKKFTHTTDGGALHNSHLHSSFDESTVTEVKE